MQRIQRVEQETLKMKSGNHQAIMSGFSDKGAILRTNAIIYAVQNNMATKDVEANLNRLSNDNTCLFGYNAGWRVCHFAQAALHLLGFCEYKGNTLEVKKIIKSEFKFE